VQLLIFHAIVPIGRRIAMPTVVGYAQVSAQVCKRICKRDAAELAESGETLQAWRDKHLAYTDVSQAERDHAVRLRQASHCS
jgi:hypothetical protein